MKLKLERKALAAAVLTAASLVPARPPVFAHRYLKFVSKKGVLHLEATSNEEALRIRLDFDGERRDGAFMVLASKFSSLLRVLNDDFVELNGDAKSVNVKSGRSKFTLKAIKPDEWFLDQVNWGNLAVVEFSTDELRLGIERTVFACEAAEYASTYAMSGVLLDWDGSSITFVGCDGRRLAWHELKSIESLYGLGKNTIVPIKSAKRICDLAGMSEKVELSVSKGVLHARSLNFEYSCRLLEGKFPDWRNLLPRDRDSTMYVVSQASEFLKAIRQAAITTDADHRAVRFAFDGDVVTLSNQTPEAGNSKIRFKTDHGSAEESVEACLDHRFCTQFLDSLGPDDSLVIDLVAGDNRVVFDNEAGTGHLIMGMEA